MENFFLRFIFKRGERKTEREKKRVLGEACKQKDFDKIRKIAKENFSLKKLDEN